MSEQRDLDGLIADLCKTILRKADDIDCEAVENYVKGLTPEEATILNKSTEDECVHRVRLMIQINVFQYLDSFQLDTPSCSPFDFDTSENHSTYIDCFSKAYEAKYNSANVPKIFFKAFEYIKDASEYYRFFEKFNKLHNEDINEMIDSAAENAASKASKNATRATKMLADIAVERAQQAIAKASESADEVIRTAGKTAKQIAEEKANEMLESVVNEKLKAVSEKVTETSVVILGMFTGIVFALVTGVVYASSVLESINLAEFGRLLCVTAIVGFVFFNVLLLMFRFIARVGGKDENLFAKDKQVRWVNVTLIVLLIIGLVWTGVANINKGTSKNNETEKTAIETSANTSSAVSSEKTTSSAFSDVIVTEIPTN